MKRRCITAVAVLTAAALLAGCSGGKKEEAGNKDTSQNAAESEDRVSKGENEDSTQDTLTDGDDSKETAANDSKQASEDVLNVKVMDYVKLGDYKGLEVTYPAPAKVTEEEIKQYIEGQLEEKTEYKEDKNRAAKEGDSLNIDYTGKIDGEEFEGGSDTGYDLVLGSGEFLEDFENGLIGKKAGETAVVTVKFPEDYDEELGGKEAEFTIKVNSVSQVIVPEYNDAFVKEISDSKNKKEYEESVKEELAANADSDSKLEAGENALRMAVENAKTDGYPQELYDFFYDDTVSGYQAYAEMLGMEYEELMESFMSEEDLVQVVKDSVNEYLIAQAILEQEGQQVTDEDYAQRAQKMAEDNEYESLEEYEADYGKTYIMTQVVREKAVDFLRESAKLKEVPYDEYYEDDEEEESDEEAAIEETEEEE